MSYQGKKNIPRITVSGAPGAAACVFRSLAASCAAGGAPWILPASLVRSPGRDWDPGSRGWRAAVSPAGAPGATQTERPWRLGKTKQRGNPKSGAENFGLRLLFSPPAGNFQITHGLGPSLDPRASRDVSVRCPRRGVLFFFRFLLARRGMER